MEDSIYKTVIIGATGNPIIPVQSDVTIYLRWLSQKYMTLFFVKAWLDKHWTLHAASQWPTLISLVSTICFLAAKRPLGIIMAVRPMYYHIIWLACKGTLLLSELLRIKITVSNLKAILFFTPAIYHMRIKIPMDYLYIYRVFRKNCIFFTIHCNTSLAFIAIRDLQSS